MSPIRAVCSLAMALAAAGCGLVLDSDLDSNEDGGDDASVDSRVGDVAEMDTFLPVPDATPVDAPTPSDGSVDATTGCLPAALTSDVVAHYTFDSDPAGRISDETGDHHGVTENGVTHVDDGYCGRALMFPVGSPMPHGHIRDHADFDIPEGSLEFHVRVPAHASYGILSRDEQNVREPGHLSIYLSIQGHLIVRLQDVPVSSGGFGDNAVWLCSNRPLEIGEWEHVGLSWGGDQNVQLWLGGELATYNDRMSISYDGGSGLTTALCGNTERPLGIDGNSLSWILGANASLRRPTAPDALTAPFADGAIDELRIFRRRRDFTSP